jgi:hypothetical protein
MSEAGTDLELGARKTKHEREREREREREKTKHDIGNFAAKKFGCEERDKHT